MAKKTRDLIAYLIENGFVRIPFGKGSHRRYKHPTGVRATIPGHDNDDVKAYLEIQIRKKIREAKSKEGQ